MSVNNEIISQKYNNHQYAPGIATYGIDGKTGETGDNGNNIYYTDYTIKSDNQNSTDLTELLEKIINGYMPIKNINVPVNRPYKAGDMENGDLFFDREGIIYRLINKDFDKKEIISADTYIKYFKIVGKINVYEDQNFFAFSPNRLILNSKYTGYDIINTPNIDTDNIKKYIDDKSVVNIISSVVDENDNIEMVRLQSIDDVDIEDGQMTIYYKTTDNAFFIDSNKPMVINGDFKVLQSDEQKDTDLLSEYDDYSTVLTSNDTITYFKYICDKLNYSTLYDSDINRYKLLIFQKDKNRDILDYLINRNETVFGKIYTEQNEQILVKLNDIINSGQITSNKIANYIPTNDITTYNRFIQCNDCSLNNFIGIKNSSIYVIEKHNNINKSISLDVSLNVTIDDNTNILHDETYYEQQLLQNILGVKISYINNENSYNIDSDGNIIIETGKLDGLTDIFVKNGRYKFTFNTTDIKSINGNKSIKIDILPTLEYSTGVPISYDIILDKNLNGIYILYFTIERSNNNFGIHDIMIDTVNIPNINHDEYVDNIQILIPTNINSIQKFALMHNTEIFLEYINDIPYASNYQYTGKVPIIAKKLVKYDNYDTNELKYSRDYYLYTGEKIEYNGQLCYVWNRYESDIIQPYGPMPNSNNELYECKILTNSLDLTLPFTINSPEFVASLNNDNDGNLTYELKEDNSYETSLPPDKRGLCEIQNILY